MNVNFKNHLFVKKNTGSSLHLFHPGNSQSVRMSLSFEEQKYIDYSTV